MRATTSSNTRRALDGYETVLNYERVSVLGASSRLQLITLTHSDLSGTFGSEARPTFSTVRLTCGWIGISPRIALPYPTC